MRSALAFAALALLALSAVDADAQQRPALRGVSSIRVGNYNSPSVLFEGREKVGPVVSELNALRSKPWRGGDTKLACYATLVVMSGKKTLGTFRIRPEAIVEREGHKGVPVYNLAIQAADIPAISRMLTEIPPAKDCN